MSRTIILYGSTSGNTERVARLLAGCIEGGADLFSVGSFSLDKLSGYELILLGISTWGVGEPQGDWDEALPELAHQDLSGKTVALFGLGDAMNYGDSFVDALGALHGAVAESGARRVGFWGMDGYDFSASQAVKNGCFVGLVLDEDNQAELTPIRLRQWAAEVQVA